MHERDVERHRAYYRPMRPIGLLLALAIALPLSAKQRAVGHPVPDPAGPTFNKEVVRIFQQHCQSCHHDGDVAPFSLVTYADARPNTALIKFMTQSRQMPPWKPSPDCGDFADERRLTQDEINTIVQWVDHGAPEGNRADLPQPLDFGSGWVNGQPDLVLKNAESFTPAAEGDTYRCFSLPTNLTSTAYVRAVDTHPGDRETVHHVLTFIDNTGVSKQLDEADPGPGYTCFGGPGFDTVGSLGGWAPGARPLEMPDDVGFELQANSRVVLQVHYHPHHGAPEPDQTQFGVYFASTPPKNLMRILPIINDTFVIPAGAAAHQVNADFPLLIPLKLKIWFIAPHMHLLGKKMTVEMTLPGGAKQCLIDIQNWEFHWQGTYMYKTPVAVPANTRLSLRAIYDNSANNPNQPNNPPQDVGWGEATTDEMCIAFLGVTVD
jgi:hypothetical protein